MFLTHLLGILFEYVCLCFLAFSLYAIVKVLYNIFLHPLRKYPGSLLWTSTRLTWCYYMQSGHLHSKLHELHEKYGPVVRIAPNELSYIDAQAWKDIYMPRSGHAILPKTDVWAKPQPGAPHSIVTIDESAHTRNRRALMGAFTEHAVNEHATVLEHFVGLMIEKFKERAASKEPQTTINIVDWLNFLTFDISGYLSFGESFDSLQNGKAHPWVDMSVNFGKGIALMASVNFWSPLDKILSWTIPKSVLAKMKYHQELAREKLRQRLETPERSKTQDFVGSILKYNEQKGEVKIPPEELEVNMTILIFAGSETTSTAMASIVNALLRHPEALRRVQDEVRNTFAEEDQITVSSVAHLEYLTAVIKEGIRLGPPAAVMLPRVVPPQGDMICDQWVPGGTFVSLNQYPAFRSPHNFAHPESFIPERFLEKSPFPTDDLAVFNPFLIGRHQCLGQRLAWAEMRLTLARLLWAFDIKTAQEVRDFGEQETYMLWQKKPLEMEIRLRDDA